MTAKIRRLKKKKKNSPLFIAHLHPNDNTQLKYTRNLKCRVTFATWAQVMISPRKKRNWFEYYLQCSISKYTMMLPTSLQLSSLTLNNRSKVHFPMSSFDGELINLGGHNIIKTGVNTQPSSHLHFFSLNYISAQSNWQFI